jgi:selenocysteine lyase/cysteine desulfurase
MDPETGQLDWSDFERLITKRTRMVAFGAGCNALGTVNRYRDAVKLAHSVGALALVDAVHYAPYFLCDVKDTDCDFLTASAYKFYGPHASVFYGKKDLLESIDFPKLQPAPDNAPERAEMGTQNHEGIAGAAAAIDFYASLARVRTGSDSDRLTEAGQSRRALLESAFAGLREHSRPLVNRLWEELSRIKGVRLMVRRPTLTGHPRYRSRSKTLLQPTLPRRMAERGLFVSHGDFYAQTVIERLGLAPEGLVRVGCACYTSDEEIERLIEAAKEIAG